MCVVSLHMAMVRCVCVVLLAVWLVSSVSDAAKKVVKEKVRCACVCDVGDNHTGGDDGVCVCVCVQ